MANCCFFICNSVYCVFVGEKDVAEIYNTMLQGQVVPLIFLTIAVSLLKVLAIAGIVLLVKWFLTKKKD